MGGRCVACWDTLWLCAVRQRRAFKLFWVAALFSRTHGGAAREERAGSARSVPHNTNRLCKALIGPTIEQEAQSTLHVKVNLKVRRFY